MTAALDLRARRLTLAAAELEVLRRRTGVPLPGDLVAEADEAALAAAAAALAGRGVLAADGAAHPSVAANLAVLAAPELVVLTRVQHPDARVRAWHAVAGAAGASLIATSDRAVELSLFAAADLRRELLRAVPEAGALAGEARGVLHGLVVRPGTPPAAGQVLWWATPGGWLGARPEPDRRGGRRLRLVPARREDYPGWLAPLVAEALG